MKPAPATALSVLLAAASLLTLHVPARSGPAAAMVAAPAYQPVPHDVIYSMSVEGRRAVAVGGYGLILSSSDSGASWSAAQAPAKVALLSVVQKSGRCIAAGQQGTIVRSPDCVTWVQSKAATQARLLAVDANAQGAAVAVGEFGALLTSADWGANWQVLPIDWRAVTGMEAEPHLYDVSMADDGVITMVGEFELVMRSADGGKHWEVLHKGTRSLFGLKVGKGAWYAVGQEGLILSSGDAGKSWEQRASGTGAVLTDVWSDGGKCAIAVGLHTVLATDDGGASWKPRASVAALAGWHMTVKGIDGPSGKKMALIAGRGGVILQQNVN